MDNDQKSFFEKFVTCDYRLRKLIEYFFKTPISGENVCSLGKLEAKNHEVHFQDVSTIWVFEDFAQFSCNIQSKLLDLCNKFNVTYSQIELGLFNQQISHSQGS